MTSQKQVAGILVGVLVVAIALVVGFTFLPSGPSVSSPQPSAPSTPATPPPSQPLAPSTPATPPPSQPLAPSTPATPPPSQPSAKRINLNLGEVDLAGPYGFALNAENVVSPGPRIVVKVGDTVTISVTNSGQLPHNFAVVAEPGEGAETLFNSAIGSGSSPLVPNESGTVTFTVGQPGTFSYICQVPGHPTVFKMFGEFVVEQ